MTGCDMFNFPPPYNNPVTPQSVMTTAWMRWVASLCNFLTLVTDFTQLDVQVPIAGFTITMEKNAQVLVLNPAGVLATGTVVLPPTPYDGQSVHGSSTTVITTFTLSPSGSETVKNAPTTLAAGIGFRYVYRAEDTTWYRLH